MGMLRIDTSGSFPRKERVFSALEHGHAHAVAQAIQYLATEVLPEAIERDHKLHDGGMAPHEGFKRP